MLLNDVTRNDKMNGLHTRDLQNAVVRHHKNNPHISREAAFEYIMSISATFRALPSACIEKARRYLALPETSTKVPNGHIPHNGQQTVDYLVGLTNDLASISGTSIHGTTSHTISFDSACDRLGKLKNLRIEDMIKARKELGLPTQLIESVASTTDHNDLCDPSIVGPKEQTKPGTTVVHAEHVVVDNKKMIKILKFENIVYMKTLPKEYLAGLPKFYRYDSLHREIIMIHETISSTNKLAYSVSSGTIMSLKDFGQMIKTMKEAGVRLSKINKTAKLEKEHSGKFTVNI